MNFKILLSVVLACVSMSLHAVQDSGSGEQPKPKKRHIEHIFVHGTHGAILGTGKVAETWREQKKYYAMRLMSGTMGLINYNKIERDICAPYIIDACEEIYKQVEPDAIHVFSLFNWSGKLSDTERKAAGEKLHDAIKIRRDALKADGIDPEFRVYGHSWGGAVELYLGDYDDIKDWHIKLMLLASPIDSRSEDLLEKFCAKGGYALLLYSYNDLIQIVDVISGTEVHTRHCVKADRLAKLGDHFTQVRVRTDMAYADKAPGFWELQAIAARNICHGGKALSGCPLDPTHADFWCVDWKQKYPFYIPLPMITWGALFWQFNKPADIDVSISHDANDIIFTAQEHMHCKKEKKKKDEKNTHPVLATQKVPLTVVKAAQAKLLAGKSHTTAEGVDTVLQMVA